MASISRCYDSHAHFVAASVFKYGIDCSQNQWELGRLNQLRGSNSDDFVIFGWGWTDLTFILQRLSQFEEEQAARRLALSRKDGHALLINEPAYLALQPKLLRLKQNSDWLLQHLQHYPFQNKHYFVLQEGLGIWAWTQLLQSQEGQLDFFLLESQKLWREAGFTHVRDMSGNWKQWQALMSLEQRGVWHTYLVQNFEYHPFLILEEVIDEILQAQKFQSSHPHLRVGGIKLYLDGTIGFKTAAMTCGAGPFCGSLLWSDQALEDTIAQIWARNIPVCLHTIGDRAVAQALTIYERLAQKGCEGIMHLEHVEWVQKRDLPRFQKKNLVIHAQPCHWLADLGLLKSSQHPSLEDISLPDESLVFCPYYEWLKLKIPVFWGFDAPIYYPQLGLNWRGLLDTASMVHRVWGVSLPEATALSSWTHVLRVGHEYPDPSWGACCVSDFDENNAWRPEGIACG
ncbi:MAG: amidohydrolase family protein [Bdellovibrionaceae bacterium]|nr:amidohydrolase family protein [Pseudobdellovibrionaceae bacterium]